MPIITISRGSYSRGKEVAEKVAERLGYKCIARDVLIEASNKFNVEEVKLVHAISDAPSIFQKISYSKERYIAYIRAALLADLKMDNVVYHGMAGHFFVRNISHAIKIRIIADLEDRIKLVMDRDGVSRKEAVRFIQRVDKERKRWSQHLYGIDTTDASLYDFVLNLRKMTVKDAVEIICCTAQLENFQATDESRRAIEDEALAAAVKAALVEQIPEAQVTSKDGAVSVIAKTSAAKERRLSKEIEQIAKRVSGVKEVKVQLDWVTPFGT
jgi:cytidylate kinase